VLGRLDPRRLLSAVDRDAALEGLPRRWARVIFWLPTLGIPGLAAVYVGYKWGFYWVLREDHVVEWTQFAVLSVASLSAFVAAVRFARQHRWFLAALLVLVGLALFGMVGEEISWGQRVFGWQTPSSLEAANRQGETNLHNIDGGIPVAADQISDYLELTLGLGGAALSLLARPVRSRLHRTVLWELAPPLVAIPGFAWMIVYQLVTLATQSGAAPLIVYQEWFEVGFYGSIALTVVAVFSRAAQGRIQFIPAQRRRPRRAGPHAPAGFGPIVVLALFSIAVSFVFAILTTWTGMRPGNVPDSLAG